MLTGQTPLGHSGSPQDCQHAIEMNVETGRQEKIALGKGEGKFRCGAVLFAS